VANSHCTLTVEIQIQNHPELTIVRVDGEIRMTNARELRESLVKAAESRKYRVIIDMRAVASVDSTGLGLLISCARSFREYNGDLRLFGVPHAILMLLRMERLDSQIEMFESEDQAIASFTQPPI